MSKELHDKIKAPPANAVPLDSYTDEQIEQLVIQLALIARRGLFTDSDFNNDFKEFSDWYDKIPEELRKRVYQAIDDEDEDNSFWVAPADAVLTIQYNTEEDA